MWYLSSERGGPTTYPSSLGAPQEGHSRGGPRLEGSAMRRPVHAPATYQVSEDASTSGGAGVTNSGIRERERSTFGTGRHGEASRAHVSRRANRERCTRPRLVEMGLIVSHGEGSSRVGFGPTRLESRKGAYSDPRGVRVPPRPSETTRLAIDESRTTRTPRWCEPVRLEDGPRESGGTRVCTSVSCFAVPASNLLRVFAVRFDDEGIMSGLRRGAQIVALLEKRPAGHMRRQRLSETP